MDILNHIWHGLKAFFYGWQPHDYVTTLLAVAAFVLSVRREIKDRTALRMSLALEKSASSVAGVSKIAIVLDVVNSGTKPLSIANAEGQVWDSEQQEFLQLEEVSSRFLAPAQTAKYTLELGFRSLRENKVGKTNPMNFLVTAIGVRDSEGRTWKVTLRDIAAFTTLTARAYPRFELSAVGSRLLLLRLHFYAWRVFLLRAVLSRHKVTRFE